MGHLAPAVLSVVAVFVLGSLPIETPANLQFSMSDKVGHFFLFGLVQLTHLRALLNLASHLQLCHAVYLSALSATVFGGLLEVWQFLLPHRSAEWADFLADGIGAAVFGLASFYVVSHRSTRESA